MKKRLLSMTLGVTAVLNTPAQSTSIVYDSFNYTPPGTAVSTAGAPSWALYAPAGTDPKIAAGSLSYPGLQTASGDNSVVFDGVAPAAGISARNLGQVYNISNASTLYYSLTFRVTSIGTADWGGTGNYLSGSFMMGLNQKDSAGSALAQGDVAAPLLIRTGDPTNASGTANDFQQYQLGTGATATTAVRTFDGAHNYNPGDTLLIVLSYTFGAGANDDIARLYVNPTPGSLQSANTPVVVTALGAADVVGNQAQSFFLRNNSVEPTSTVIDDLRIGTTWADVTPVPEPTTAMLGGLGLLLLLPRNRSGRS